jgi:hypothetical protein
MAHTCIPATQEAEIRPPREIMCESLSQKASTQNRAPRMTQVVEHLPSKCRVPKFKPQYHLKN